MPTPRFARRRSAGAAQAIAIRNTSSGDHPGHNAYRRHHRARSQLDHR